jgi:hypothetical protein
VFKLKQTLFLKKILKKKSKKRENFELFFDDLVGCSLGYHPGHFGAFILPLRPHKTSDQYFLELPKTA